uniref:gamma-glutamylcyclotransferase family protein n=1 Tax=Microbacterium sp. SORGH_AS_1204 TaxID=3041785 RepID=UPI0027D886C6|nr:gamma-glutamylcyclotransferase family protein [Microbacterium sp. SORGH_AS_1204]
MNDGSGTRESLFTYGALQAPDVQLDTFGRLVGGDDDTLSGFRLDDGEGPAERGAATMHGHRRRTLRHTGDPLDRVFGTVLHLSPAELEAADEYLMSGSRRVSVVLVSGVAAWVYVAA